MLFCYESNLIDSNTRVLRNSILKSVVLIGAITAFGFAISFHGVTRDRKGLFAPWFALKNSEEQSVIPRPVAFTPFSGPLTAQYWYECRTRVWIAPLICAILTFGFVLFQIWSNYNYRIESHGDSAYVFLILPALISLWVGLIFGIRRQNRRAGLWVFHAVHPVSDKRLAQPIIHGALISFLACMIPAIIVVIVHVAIFRQSLLSELFLTANRRSMTLVNFSRIFWVAACVMVAQWVFIGNTIAIILSGRKWVIATAALVAEAIVVAAVVISMQCSPEFIMQLLAVTSVFVAAMGLLFVVFVIAKGLYSWPNLVFSIIVYLFGIWLTILAYGTGEGFIPSLIPLCLLTLVLTPPASISFALSKNRHR